jgi:iron complex transport system ATP-binding protein
VVSGIRAERLEFSYADGPRALAGVDLELGKSEFAVLVGPNGSGKSTLVRCLAGLLRPSAGRSLVSGEDVLALPARERARRIAIVPQLLAGLHDVRVDDFVLGGRYARIDRWRGPTRADRDAVLAALGACDVAALGERALSELSGGQRQRVVIARALAQEAPILLVDEPTTALDPDHQVQVFELLAQLADGGRAVMVVTHELNLAAQFARSMLVLDGGRIVARGSVSEILRPEVLAPVYGPRLEFGKLADGRPFVVPSRATAR